MKRNKSTFLVLLYITLFLGGCKTGDYVTPEKMAKMQGSEIMVYVKNKDTEGFKELFCSYMKDSRPSLDREIEKFLDFIDGEIISYDEPDGKRGSGTIRPEGVSEEVLNGNIENITTDTGRHYRIALSSFSVNKDSPELVGLMSIKIFDIDTYDPENGYPEGATYSIYYRDEPE